jgi:uncharacterized protein
MPKPRLPQLKAYVIKEVSKDKRRNFAHGLDHLLRVYRIGMSIGRKENADLDVLGPALLLHDIIRPIGERKEKEHARASAKLAKKITLRFGYSEEEAREIEKAILDHSRSDREAGKKSLEAMILYDADKLDGIGPIGIKRVKAFCEARGYNSKQTARWYLYRITDIIKNEPFYTTTRRSMAKQKLQASLRFCKKNLGDDYKEILKEEDISEPIL